MKYSTTMYTSDIKDVDNMDGFEFEKFCCELLRRNGYKNVIGTKSSGDYGLDVIATKDDIVYGLQCKNYKGTVGIKAVQEAMSGSQYYRCHVPVVLTNSTFTKQAIEMANRTNVKLWDRNKLIALIQVFPKKESLNDFSQKETTIQNHIKDAKSDIHKPIQTAESDDANSILGCLGSMIILIVLLIMGFISWKWFAILFAISLLGALAIIKTDNSKTNNSKTNNSKTDNLIIDNLIDDLKKEYDTYLSKLHNIKHIDKMNSQIQFHKFCCDLLEYNKFTVIKKEVYFNGDIYIYNSRKKKC